MEWLLVDAYAISDHIYEEMHIHVILVNCSPLCAFKETKVASTVVAVQTAEYEPRRRESGWNSCLLTHLQPQSMETCISTLVNYSPPCAFKESEVASTVCERRRR